MVEITLYGVVLDTPYGELKISFGRSYRVEISEQDVQTTVPMKKFEELVEKIRNGNLPREKLDLLREISKLPGGWKQSTKVKTLLEADTEKQLEDFREEVNSMLKEKEKKQRERKEFRQAWENVEEKGYYAREYRGSKLRYLIVCGEYRRTFYVIQLPPEYDFEVYRGKSSRQETLGRRLEKSPSKLIDSYNPNREEGTIRDLQDDKEALKNLGKGLDALPEPQKSELEKRLVALKLTGEKR